MSIKELNSTLQIKPSAFIPITMSHIALAMVLVHWAVVGIVHEADEGTLAHIFQLLMVLQIPVVNYFLLSWVDKMPKKTLRVVALQAAAWLSVIAAVYFLT